MTSVRELIDVRIAINKYVTEMAKLLPADPEETEQILDRIAALVPNFGFDRDKIRSFILGITLPKPEPCDVISTAEEEVEEKEIAEEDCNETPVEEVVDESVVIETPAPLSKNKPTKKKKRAYKFLTDKELLQLMELIPRVDGLHHTDACDVISKLCPSITKKTIGRVLSKTTFKNKTDPFFELRDGIILSNKKKK
jgi:hypothetical protein